MGGGVVLVLVRRSQREVEEECVTLMSCCPRIFQGFGEQWCNNRPHRHCQRGAAPSGSAKLVLNEEHFLKIELKY